MGREEPGPSRADDLRPHPTLESRRVGRTYTYWLMTRSGRERLAVLLAGATGPGAFTAARTAPTGDLHLEVRGVGPIELPVSQEQARQLCLVGRPARYGRGEQTVLDRGVRDTLEIPKSRVRIDKRRWNQTLLPVLDRVGRDLGLPSGCTLRAELHAMLVYARGQFFVEHQDSEKDDEMVGTLVVGLPSAFRGGALEVRHRGETATFRGSKKALSFVAFYEPWFAPGPDGEQLRDQARRRDSYAAAGPQRRWVGPRIQTDRGRLRPGILRAALPGPGFGDRPPRLPPGRRSRCKINALHMQRGFDRSAVETSVGGSVAGSLAIGMSPKRSSAPRRREHECDHAGDRAG
jgi:hypothetical protein